MFLAVYTAMFVLFCLPAAGMTRMEAEYDIKSAFILNLIPFVEWPSQNARTRALVIGILGPSPLKTILDAHTPHADLDRRVEVRVIKDPQGARVCDILFVPGAANLGRLRLDMIGPGVLTIGEGDAFVAAGGILSLSIAGKRLVFDVNQAIAQRSGLRISPRLLSLARRVEQGRSGGR